MPKRSEKYIKSVIAFANTAGGKIIIGVDTIEDKCVIVIEIYPGANRPYYIKSLGKEEGTFIRVSGTSRPADEAILKDLELQGSNHSFDEMICVEQKFDINQAQELCSAIKKYMVEAAKTKSEKDKVKDVTLQNLINWGVVKNLDGNLVPTNAFVLLTNNTFPFAKIQCALFKGTERVVFIDKRDFEGPLYMQIEEAYEFVLKHINLGAEIKGLLRTEAYELPTEAIREAIVNAITHRNFLDRACVQVAVYDDRVEITSPGMLYGGLTIEQIKEGGSKIRNRCIAEVFSRMKIIESWGTGIKRMFSSCKEYGIREPELLEIGDSFRVNLYRPSYNEVHQSSPKSSPKNLNLTKQKIVEMILDNPKITQMTLSEELGITTRAVKKNVKELAEQGIIERVGSARSGYWQVKKEISF